MSFIRPIPYTLQINPQLPVQGSAASSYTFQWCDETEEREGKRDDAERSKKRGMCCVREDVWAMKRFVLIKSITAGWRTASYSFAWLYSCYDLLSLFPLLRNHAFSCSSNTCTRLRCHLISIIQLSRVSVCHLDLFCFLTPFGIRRLRKKHTLHAPCLMCICLISVFLLYKPPKTACFKCHENLPVYPSLPWLSSTAIRWPPLHPGDRGTTICQSLVWDTTDRESQPGLRHTADFTGECVTFCFCTPRWFRSTCFTTHDVPIEIYVPLTRWGEAQLTHRRTESLCSNPALWVLWFPPTV